MGSGSDQSEKSFEMFEFCAACLMGLGAVGAALSGYQGGLWGGQMTDAYSEGAAVTTKASALYNDELTSYMQDAQADKRAKELIWVAEDSDNEELRTRNFEIASWLYLSQLSDPGYAALKLPAATKAAFEKGEDQVFEEEELQTAFSLDLDEKDDYENTLFSGSRAEYKKAEDLYTTARSANTIGDKFALSGLIQTVGLFFAGLALVFKTGIRWGFLAAGALVFGAGTGFMFTLPFAG